MGHAGVPAPGHAPADSHRHQPARPRVAQLPSTHQSPRGRAKQRQDGAMLAWHPAPCIRRHGCHHDPLPSPVRPCPGERPSCSGSTAEPQQAGRSQRERSHLPNKQKPTHAFISCLALPWQKPPAGRASPRHQRLAAPVWLPAPRHTSSLAAPALPGDAGLRSPPWGGECRQRPPPERPRRAAARERGRDERRRAAQCWLPAWRRLRGCLSTDPSGRAAEAVGGGCPGTAGWGAAGPAVPNTPSPSALRHRYSCSTGTQRHARGAGTPRPQRLCAACTVLPALGDRRDRSSLPAPQREEGSGLGGLLPFGKSLSSLSFRGVFPQQCWRCVSSTAKPSTKKVRARTARSSRLPRGVSRASSQRTSLHMHMQSHFVLLNP